MASLKLKTTSGGSITISPNDTAENLVVSLPTAANGILLTTSEFNSLLTQQLGVTVQAYDADLTTWATKTAPTGDAVGTSDTQTLTNKTIALGSNTVSGTLAQFNTAITDADIASISGTETLTNKTLTTPIITGGKETKVAMPANNVDLLTGNFFTKTITTATTLTVSNVPTTGNAASFILDLTNGGAGTITWWSGVKWAGGTAPTLTASGRDVLGFFTHDGGTTWTGLLLGKDVK